MRDVKNDICQDCELVALLEDDNGIELPANNKIINLNLLDREVLKVWVAEAREEDAMCVVYLMPGLLGDAMSEQNVNRKGVYKMANGEGLQIMLNQLWAIKDTSRGCPLLQVLLKLFQLCLKVQHNQEVLTKLTLVAMGILQLMPRNAHSQSSCWICMHLV